MQIRTKYGPVTAVYVAGKLSGPPVEYLKNCRTMTRHAYELIRRGYHPYCPGWDMHLVLSGGDMEIEDYYEYSLAMMERMDAVIVDPDGAEESKGTQGEIARALEIGMPVCLGATWEDSLRQLEALRKAADARLYGDFGLEYAVLIERASEAIGDVLLSAGRQKKHPPWSWQSEEPAEHVLKAARHLLTDEITTRGYQADADEPCLKNALTRLTMALSLGRGGDE